MAPKYNLFFVPHFKERLKISKLRSQTCKTAHSTQALQYPVHMSLISGGANIKDYDKFERELKDFCRTLRPMTLKAERYTAVLTDRFWTGIHIARTGALTKIQSRLQVIRNKYADEKEKHPFYPPHITLAFPAKVKGLEPKRSPVTYLEFNRITIVRKDKELEPYRIFKRIKLG